MNAEIFNDIRRITFSLFHKNGSSAFDYLKANYSTLGLSSYRGLFAELEFYSKFRNDYSLTLAADVGDHADFAGVIEGKPVRIDVTTNINYKNYKDYEKYLCDGYEYKIVHLNKDNWEIIDVLNLSFPYCNQCKKSFKFPLAFLLPMNFGLDGDPKFNYDQKIVYFCPKCGFIEEIMRINDTLIRTSQDMEFEYENNNNDFNEMNDIQIMPQSAVEAEMKSNIKFLTKVSGVANLAGVMEGINMQQHENGVIEYGYIFPYLNNAIKKKFPWFYPVCDAEL